VIVASYTLFAALFLPQTVIFNSQSPTPLSWPKALARNFIPAYIWAVLTPPIFWFSSRYPIGNKRWPARAGLHFLLSIVFSTIQSFAYSFLIGWVISGTPTTRLPSASFMASMVTNGVVFYWSILAIHHAIRYFRQYKDREYRLVQSRLQALKTQLHPHFLFNTLNAISELVYRDPEAADRAITQLSDLLRITLGKHGAEEVTLKEELEFLEKYIAIHRMLLQDRLRVEVRVDPETLDASVPDLILQPLVENALRHGIDPRSGTGRIEIAASRKNGVLRLSVRDNGPGLQADWQGAAGRGIGLANTQARLEHLYGKSHRFDLKNLPEGGLAVNIEVPFRELDGKANYESSNSDR